MNLLAHLQLSKGCDPDTLTANVLADYLGRYDPVERMPEKSAARFMKGILLHREIDRFTDQHTVVAEARELISIERRRLAGIIVDIVFDYYLSRHWSRFNDEVIETVISRGYSTMAQVASTGLAPKTASLIGKMRLTDWLGCYGTLEGQSLTFRRVSQRSRVVEKLVGAEEEIVKNDAALDDCFLRFYPELQANVAAWTAANRT